MKMTSNLGHEPKIFKPSDLDRLTTSASSKGNQTKWALSGHWIKADFFGYEGLAECLASWVAKQTTIKDFAPIADYFPCHIHEGVQTAYGCFSENFLKAGEVCVTIARLLDATTDKGFNKIFERMSAEDRIKTVVDKVVEVTSLTNFGQWLTCLLEFDSLILNEDRHFSNIAVVVNDKGQYRFMPLFDNGAAFCSDIKKDYPLTLPVPICIRNVKAKPFNTDFKRQINACRKLYGRQLHFTLAPSDVSFRLLDGFDMYSEDTRLRAVNILKHRLDNWDAPSGAEKALTK